MKLIMPYFDSSNRNKMGNTIQIIKERAAAIIANGGPKTSEEFHVMRIHSSLTGGKAFNAGKRNDKHFQQTGK